MYLTINNFNLNFKNIYEVHIPILLLENYYLSDLKIEIFSSNYKQLNMLKFKNILQIRCDVIISLL